MNQKKDNKNQITEYSNPLNPIETIYGIVEFKNWLLSEQKRMGKKYITTEIRSNSKGEIALFLI